MLDSLKLQYNQIGDLQNNNDIKNISVKFVN